MTQTQSTTPTARPDKYICFVTKGFNGAYNPKTDSFEYYPQYSTVAYNRHDGSLEPIIKRYTGSEASRRRFEQLVKSGKYEISIASNNDGQIMIVTVARFPDWKAKELARHFVEQISE